MLAILMDFVERGPKSCLCVYFSKPLLLWSSSTNLIHRLQINSNNLTDNLINVDSDFLILKGAGMLSHTRENVYICKN